jgi:hypothetical protein
MWIGERRVTDLPAEVAEGEVVVIGSGEALFGVYPLARTNLGRGASARLVEIQGDLVLELINYQGSAKPFWELGWPGAFYKGRPQCGYYLEIAPRAAYPDGAAFGRVIASGNVQEVTAAPYTYQGHGERLWTAAYSREGQTLGIEVDLMAWKLKRRWTEAGECGWPMLASPVAQQNCTGSVEVGSAHLTCRLEPAWLFACPEKNRYVACYQGNQAGPLTLSVPGGKVEVPSMGAGMVIWDEGQVTVEALNLSAPPVVTGGKLKIER